MKLTNDEFKRFRGLSKKKTLTDDEKKELATLSAKKADSKFRGSNDVSWYTKYPELSSEASRIPFNYVAGRRIALSNGRKLPTPSVFMFNFMPTIGRSTDGTSAFNVQMNNLWLDMHRKYRGIGAYQKADVGMALIAITDIIGRIAWAERVYGIANSYNARNRSIPSGILTLMNVSENDVREHLADFRYGINRLINKIQILCLPVGMSWLENRVVLNSLLFKDSDNDRAAIFFYNQQIACKYDASKYTTGGAIERYDINSVYAPNPGQLLGYQTILQMLEDDIDVLISDDDIVKICSDILAAYGEAGVVKLAPVPSDYLVVPVHDYERNVQLHNLTITGSVAQRFKSSFFYAQGAVGPLDIYQENNIVYDELCVCSATPAYTTDTSDGYIYPMDSYSNFEFTVPANDNIFDTYTEHPTEVELLVGTRLRAQGIDHVFTNSSSGYNGKHIEVLDYGTEIILELKVWEAPASGGLPTIRVVYSTLDVNSFGGPTQTRMGSMMSFLDWHPLFYFGSTIFSWPTPAVDYDPLGDIDNPASLSSLNLSRLHDAACFSEFKMSAVTYIQ